MYKRQHLYGGKEEYAVPGDHSGGRCDQRNFKFFADPALWRDVYKRQETAIREAAMLAAAHSRARDSSQVPVDYTQVRNVNKPSGAKPGMVIYVKYNTVYVTPAASEEV